MDKVSVSLVGLKSDITRSDVQAGLEKLYSKPQSHFETHCNHLFDLRSPFVHLKNVSTEEAEKHCEGLAAIGIETEIGKAVSSALSLVPLEEKASAAAECPSCNQVTTDSEMCSACGVFIKKFLEQQAIDANLQRKLAAADRSSDLIKEAQKEEERRRKEAAKHKKTGNKTAAPDLPPESADDHFKVKVEEPSNRRVLYFAGAALLASVVGTSYFMLHIKDNLAQKEQYDYATIAESDTMSDPQIATAVPAPEIEALIETGSFKSWAQKIDEVKKLKNDLNILNETVGMSSTMEGVLTETTDPFVRIIGSQYLVKLRVQTDPQKLLSTRNDSGVHYSDILTNNLVLVQSLSSTNEQLYARLNLAQIYTELQQHDLTDVVLEQAKITAIDIASRGSASQKVIAEVTSAAYFAQHDTTGQMTKHYDRAVEFSRQIEPDTDDARWAIPFIARNQASSDQYVAAYELLEQIEDPQVSELVMEDIKKYASTDNISIDELNPLITDTSEFSDDPDLQLLYQNQETMRQNAEKLSTFTDQ